MLLKDLCLCKTVVACVFSSVKKGLCVAMSRHANGQFEGRSASLGLKFKQDDHFLPVKWVVGTE